MVLLKETAKLPVRMGKLFLSYWYPFIASSFTGHGMCAYLKLATGTHVNYNVDTVKCLSKLMAVVLQVLLYVVLRNGFIEHN